MRGLRCCRHSTCHPLSQDRARLDRLPHLTHELVAYPVAVRSVGITGAASDLQRRGLIGYHRGEITVLDRAGLEDAACGCYVADRQAYDRDARLIALPSSWTCRGQ